MTQFVTSIATLVSLFLTGVYSLILVRALISWINPELRHSSVTWLRRVTDPVLEPFRKMLMPVTLQLGVDLSPMIAFFAIVLIQRMLGGVLLFIAHRLP